MALVSKITQLLFFILTLHSVSTTKTPPPKSNNSDTIALFQSKGYSNMAKFLERHLLGYQGNEDGLTLTVFAPSDKDHEDICSVTFLEICSILSRHMFPSKLKRGDIVDLMKDNNYSFIRSSVNGLGLTFTRADNTQNLWVNGQEIVYPDMWESEFIVIHGIRGVIPMADDEEYEDMFSGLKTFSF